MIEFDQELHQYKLDGKIVPSVTQITGSLVDFSGVPDCVLDRKRQIGTALHKAIELHVRDDLVMSSLAPEVTGYFYGFLSFLDDTKFRIRNNEKRVASKKYQYAGTLDLDGYLNDKISLIDMKTTHTLSPVTAIQTAGYMQASNEDLSIDPIEDRYALWLKPDSTYVLEPYPKHSNDWNVFLSLLVIHNWRKKHGKDLSL